MRTNGPNCGVSSLFGVGLRWGTVVACAFALVGGGAIAQINSGFIVMDTNASYQGPTTNDLGGVTVQMHYSLGPGYTNQNCFTTNDLRWLQRVVSSTNTGFTPTPNRPFIDPRTGQDIGGTNGDSLPFYDVSYTDAGLSNWLQNGSGQFMFDMPAVLQSRGPYSFTAETLLVGIGPGNMLGVLGGVRWGFTISNDMLTVTSLGSIPLNSGDMLLDSQLLTNFNTALALDFPGYSVKSSAELWSAERPYFVVIPEPDGGLLLLALVGFALVVMARRRRTTE